ncbi:MAG: isoleucine--tRNA ligase [Bacteroidales bacterium]|nr:isoleucine--tRNA ligase [Bacteroidales bacterium]MDY3977888.1 isoleucine--tRNA ligase [Candidatus Onthomorpha sp.]MCI6644730.1 isoleucine--tRNA ligase [Bacteroidales bacterium]MCI6800016.1 isoleucine--tRNA ligase [Bacteroidales bacterium]MCI6901627.1 isoleucine--tRNA ligase [Bacteroidales bacterium]
MSNKYREYKQLDLTRIGSEVLEKWQKEDTFRQTLKLREGSKPFIFFEGPPSANGQPGIHHVMARTIKDIFCRYKSQKGYYVSRKAGWDTHGLPVELGVEKKLGITKEDIGSKISVDDYNAECRSEVMKYKDMWDKLTTQMGYWVDLDNPYITFKNEYIETLWYLLGQLYQKGYLYKGYTIQPFSPAAGTGLSSHELNMPGCYRDVKDTTAVVQFSMKEQQKLKEQFNIKAEEHIYFIAWTTTPWTLPSNTALAVGPGIDYVFVRTFNPYSGELEIVVMAKARMNAYCPEKNAALAFADYKKGDKDIPFEVLAECKGKDLVGYSYEQLMNFVSPMGNAFKVIGGDYVTTEDGTGIVHIAPTFGADDDRVAKQAGIVPLFVVDKAGKNQPMVDRQGKFFKIEDLDETFVKNYVNQEAYKEYAGRFVKNAYDNKLTEKDPTLDVDLSVLLKQQGKAFKIEKHVHNYPHCWRTDKPILYYPLDSWFIKTTAIKDRLIELNKTINWKPEATGSGRFGNWLENLVDWNLSRSRYWGTPLPIWRSEEGDEEKCISSVEMLSSEIEKSIAAGFMSENPYKDFKNYDSFDLHRPYIDNVILVSESGKKMFREPDLIDVWFDSGAMPYAQVHYPFDCNDEQLKACFPADFIAEGVDQTRGWFFTLHAIAALCFDSVAYKNVVSNGLVLDKAGNKMSKRLGNAVDPFEVLNTYGADATRWYMITNTQPWENLKFDKAGIDEVRRKFFGTLYNTYSFFALYANIDGFTYKEADIEMAKRPEIDRWILSELNTLTDYCDKSYSEYEPTKAGRAIADFVDGYLSNWYVRLCRRRFWKGEYTCDKISAYQTLYTCLETIARLAAPIAPFFCERLFDDLNSVSGRFAFGSVHAADFPQSNPALVDKELENRMQTAQKICSLVLSLRKRNNLKVRQPLSRIMIPAKNAHQQAQIEAVKDLILSEVNVKTIDFLSKENNVLVKSIKANFKTLGPKFGAKMKAIAAAIASFSQEDIATIECEGRFNLTIGQESVEIALSDVEIITQDIPGWVVANEDDLTVALDTTITESLRLEGISRELVNRIQNIRKEQGFDVTDNIIVEIEKQETLCKAAEAFRDYICSETLTQKLIFSDKVACPLQTIDVIEGTELAIRITKA